MVSTWPLLLLFIVECFGFRFVVSLVLSLWGYRAHFLSLIHLARDGAITY